MAEPFPTEDPTILDPYPELDEDVDYEVDDDGTILIGSPDDNVEESELREFDENLAKNIDDTKLREISSQIQADYNLDYASRENEWMQTYKDGLKSMTGADVKEEKERSNKKLSSATHPLIAEAAVQFQARAIVELFPPSGPVGTTVVGETTNDIQRQANRVSMYMNYQLTEVMTEYFHDLDKMLLHLPLVGMTFKKSWFDANLKRNTSRFITGKDFVVDPNAVDLPSADRYTHDIRMNVQTYNTYVKNDFYIQLVQGSADDPERTTEQEIEGIEPQIITLTNDSGQYELGETHCYLDLGEADEKADGVAPYVLTWHKSTQQVCSIRRNWDPDDEDQTKLVWFVPYRFLPGLGFYGFGLYHIIGSLGKVATGALRALLDAATYSNMQGGFKLKGRMKSGEIEIGAGEFVDIDAVVDDINKAIMPLPFKEPSPTMLALLQFVVETGKRFSNTADMNIADANQNTPVGTTVALLEENTRVFSAIHKRLHRSQKQEFKLIAKLNGIYLPERYPYKVEGEDQFILRADFDERIDVIPVSDPATFSSTQRIAQAQMMLQLSQSAPELHDKYKAYKRMYEAARIPNYDEVLIDPSKTVRLDAVAENVAIMHNMPVRAYEDQDHMAHMTVLDDWFARLPREAQPLYQQGYISHRSEHMALYYRVMIQAQMGAPMPALPDFSERENIQPMSEAMDAKVTQAAAMIVNNQQQPMIGPQPPNNKAEEAANDPMKSAQMMIEVETMSIQAKTKANNEATMMKAKMDMQIKQANAQMDMQIEQIKAQAKVEEIRMRERMKSESDDKKIDAEIKTMWLKAQADIQIAQEKAATNMEAQIIQAESSARINEQNMVRNEDE